MLYPTELRGRFLVIAVFYAVFKGVKKPHPRYLTPALAPATIWGVKNDSRAVTAARESDNT